MDAKWRDVLDEWRAELKRTNYFAPLIVPKEPTDMRYRVMVRLRAMGWTLQQISDVWGIRMKGVWKSLHERKYVQR